jgi:uncharacterized membrane protein
MEVGSGTRDARMLLAAAALLSLGGLGIATYLTVVHYAHQPIACTAIGDCAYVNSSTYASLAGVPVALLGAGAYASMLALIVGAWVRRSPEMLVAAWGVALASFGFSMYLTYIELRVLEAICVYCVASASVVTALFAVLSASVWISLRDGDGEEPQISQIAQIGMGGNRAVEG